VDSVLGVDPGLDGGLALLGMDGGLIGYIRMPWTETVLRTVDHGVVKAFIGDRKPMAYVERAQAMPGQGVVGVFSYGVGFGCLLGILNAYSVGYMLVSPTTWKKAYGIGRQKRISCGLAKRLYPEIALAEGGKLAEGGSRGRSWDGVAEAILIARWGLATWERGQMNLKEEAEREAKKSAYKRSYYDARPEVARFPGSDRRRSD
jgi:crossover junction endodeoxyribonuclease RuvC